jgi:hypothetical protein
MNFFCLLYVRFAAIDVLAVFIFICSYFGIRLWRRHDFFKYIFAVQFNNFRLTFLYLYMLLA